MKVHETDDLTAVMQREGVPDSLGSCHTATVAGYLVEGHVPPDLVQKLLREHPAEIKGLAVSGMVPGSPGMDGAPQPYQVIAWHQDGSTSVYARR